MVAAPRHLIEITEDGSPTVRDTLFNATFHSIHGALTETEWVYIRHGLRFWADHNTNHQGSLRILEIGLGSGLNVAATWHHGTDLDIHFTSIEKFPIHQEAMAQISASALPHLRLKIKAVLQATWETEVVLAPGFTLVKRFADLTMLQNITPFHICFFDAFAPSAQPELWTEEVFAKLFDQALPRATLSTYCCKGAVRRAMQAAGWQVNKVPGPPGKQEMVVAVKRG